MRKSILFVVAILFSTLCSAQIVIDSVSRIGAGMTPEPDSKLSILNEDWNSGLRIETVPSNDNTYYGLAGTLMGSSNSTNFGSYNLTYGYGTGNNYGLYNRAFHHGSGLNYGIFNYSRHYGSGEHIALYNVMWYNGSGSKTGIYTFLGDDDSGNIGSQSSMYGTRTKLRARYFPNVYGHHVQLTNSGSSSAARNLYGVYVYIDGYSKKGNAYGIYSRVAKFNDGNVANYAGYFDGDVIYSSSSVITSDSSVKENIRDVKGARAILQSLKPKTYNYKKKPKQLLRLFYNIKSND